ALERGAGADVDDLAVALLAHMGDDGTARQPGAAEIDRHHAVPLGGVDLIERRARHRHGGEDRGVVDEDVDAAVALDRASGHFRDARLLGDVGAHGEATHLRRHALGRRPVELGDDDGGALLCKPAGICFADAVPATGDDRDTTLQSFHRRKYSGLPYLTARGANPWRWTSGRTRNVTTQD